MTRPPLLSPHSHAFLLADAVGAMLADLAFETDPLGRFTAFGPGRALGRNASELMGVELSSLLSGNSPEDQALRATELRSILTTIWRRMYLLAWQGTVNRAGGGRVLPAFSGVTFCRRRDCRRLWAAI